MRILHMIGSLEMGGSQSMVMALYRAIDKENVQFDFVVDCDKENVFEDEIQQLGGKIFYLPKFNGKNSIQVRSAWKKFFIEHPEYKILHSHVRSYASLYLPVAKSCGVKTIIHSHNTSNGHGIAALGKMLLQYPLRFQADYFFGCSKIAGQWLFGKNIVETDRYFMLKNAVDMDRFSFQKVVRDKIRRELAVDEHTLLVGHVGRMHPQKNHHFLLECFSQIVAQRNDVKLMLIGDGELRDEITSQVQKLGLQDHGRTLHMRAEEAGIKLQLRNRFDFSFSRAVANLRDLSEYCLPLTKVGGTFVALKGAKAQEEIDEAKAAIKILGGEIVDVKQLFLSDMGERNIVVINNITCLLFNHVKI